MSQNNNMTSKANHLNAFTHKMEAEGLPKIVIDTFAYYYQAILGGESGIISEKDISPVKENEIKDSLDLIQYDADGQNALNQSVMITLNGGLGTSMGLTKAKSLLEVKEGKTFLELILNQADKNKTRLAFMNSYSTHEDTKAAVTKLQPKTPPLYFIQHKYPKVIRNGYTPAVWPDNPDMEWNPPGHGDIYAALYTSGMLSALLNDGVQYAFIANADNLGATMDTSLLGYFAKNRFPFMMEVCQRTPADTKGGHLARHLNGRLLLREIAQCPDCDLNAFQDIQRYLFFNTNSLWVNLSALSKLINASKMIKLPLILNPKTLDPRDKESPQVYQIETAMGAAIELFEGATAVKVPSSRFYPVKKCSDLLAVRSDCFIFNHEQQLVANPERTLKRIKINLDPKFYGKIDRFDARFSHGIPSLVDCENLDIDGDVYFEKDVVIKGKVRIANAQSSPVWIKQGSIIDKDISF